MANENIRHALIIGNAGYDMGKLKNPINDAKDIAKKLEKLNFSVTLLLNSENDEMKNIIVDFYEKIKSTNAQSVFYYAGHGN